ncbi:hypothetical protein E4198_03065 [Streptomyces sp. RKND-216]|uniref:DUF1801 domain-containing protein n=1 Tax=Streptomyces sp. RKND-216 TaxID=2562581 RepID=UPI00109DD72C|nr:DUF1801 domain-containing protein [Streptomyces sp. RKND-216]THA23843.1 hypothetical protein E4198_03065 [Streptomyces sp. RKND-216]
MADAAVKWRHPAWVHPPGTILFRISGHARHASVTFTPSTREAFAAEPTGSGTGRGTAGLPHGAPAPADHPTA